MSSDGGGAIPSSCRLTASSLLPCLSVLVNVTHLSLRASSQPSAPAAPRDDRDHGHIDDGTVHDRDAARGLLHGVLALRPVVEARGERPGGDERGTAPLRDRRQRRGACGRAGGNSRSMSRRCSSHRMHIGVEGRYSAGPIAHRLLKRSRRAGLAGLGLRSACPPRAKASLGRLHLMHLTRSTPSRSCPALP